MNIHDNLEKQEIRDFLSTSILDINNKIVDIQKFNNFNSKGLSGVDCTIERLQSSISMQTELVNEYKRLRYTLSIIHDLGWNEFDVSDLIQREPNGYPSFIGTKNEYDLFVNKNKK